MAEKLKHTDVQKVMSGLAEAGIINIDSPVRTLLESAARALPQDDEVSIHVLCCNEYFLVTGIADASLEQVRAAAGEVRDALG
jgi:hypothetical protein